MNPPPKGLKIWQLCVLVVALALAATIALSLHKLGSTTVLYKGF